MPFCGPCFSIEDKFTKSLKKPKHLLILSSQQRYNTFIIFIIHYGETNAIFENAYRYRDSVRCFGRSAHRRAGVCFLRRPGPSLKQILPASATDEIAPEITDAPDETPEKSTCAGQRLAGRHQSFRPACGRRFQKYLVRVYIGSQSVCVYALNDAGTAYDQLVRTMICSTGTGNATPRGTFKLQGKYRWHSLMGGVYGQYCSRITGSILFHSVPYNVNKNPASMNEVSYSKLGRKASHGCIRLLCRDAQWIYSNVASGSTVEIVNVQRPARLKACLGQRRQYRGWDPTDPDSQQSVPWLCRAHAGTDAGAHRKSRPLHRRPPKSRRPRRRKNPPQPHRKADAFSFPESPRLHHTGRPTKCGLIRYKKSENSGLFSYSGSALPPPEFPACQHTIQRRFFSSRCASAIKEAWLSMCSASPSMRLYVHRCAVPCFHIVA